MAVTLYVVVGPSAGWADPSVAQIKAGQLAGGGAATYADTDDITGLSGAYTITPDASGLTAGVAYRAAAVASDGVTDSTPLVWTAWTQAANNVVAASGAFTLTGNVAALSVGRTLTAARGAFTLTGGAAALTAARRLTAASGAFALTGSAATLTYTPVGSTYTLAASSGAFALTGRAATFVWVRAYTMTAGAGLFALTGKQAGLSYSSGMAGRRRRTRTYTKPPDEPAQATAPAVAPILAPPTTTLMPDAQHIVVASVSRAERLAKSSEAKRRKAIEIDDERKLEELLSAYW